MKSKLKIGIVFDDSIDRVDGVQQHVKIIGRYFLSQGHTVHFLVGESDPKLNPDLEIHSLARNMKVRANQNRLTIPLPAKTGPIEALLEKENYDVLHVMVPYSPFMSGKVIKRAPASTKVVGTFHIVAATALENIGSKALATIQRSTLKRFDAWVAVSAAAQEYARSNYGIDTKVIPNPINVDVFTNKKPFDRYKDTQNIVYVNRLVERKGCGHLVDAVGHLHRQGKFENRKLIICGKGPLRESLEEKVDEHGIRDKVEFAGFISEEDKPRYLSSADIACYPSTGGESFGIVLLEGMAAGAVTLGGNNVGYSTVLGDQPDLLVDPTDTPAFADRIDELFSNNEKRDKLIKWQESVIDQYDASSVGEKLLEIYRA